ncbi:NAD-dependent epimerase/dehydratase family protein [Solimonas soli]|uniref:NAD-dependent epimerase/dehydratase family protein n=1 Tax=Solimonas soli TaxID=413479 RepID=UPI0004837E75|nr:NAD(P)H-binding protein [Solimonas soli]
MSRSALVAGATGLVGQRVVERLLRDPAYARVCVVARRPLPIAHPQLTTLISDFADLAALGPRLAADDVFCCLGTTLRRAGSRAAFADVDCRMVVDLARAARAAGAHQFLVISSVGASARALSFYLRVKGRMEAEIAGLGFAAVQILRPSLLLGERGEHRPGEAFAQRGAPLLERIARGPLQRYRPVSADAVAEAMLRLALRGERGVQVHHLPLAEQLIEESDE